MPSSSRRAARERALALLYEAEARGVSPADALDSAISVVDDYTAGAVRGIDASSDEIDELIGRFARGWDISRMPATDRAVLRLAVWELKESADVPAAVVISEAVELAKRYSTDDSGRFVNGVLAAVAAAVRPSVGPS